MSGQLNDIPGTENTLSNKVTRVTTTYSVLTTDNKVFCNTDSAGFTATLPTGTQDLTFRITNSGSSGNTLTIAVQTGEDIYGTTNGTHLLYDGESADLTYDTTDGWY